MARLNYHHLRYFHAVAQEGHLQRAAERLNVSQSALSIQIKQLEERLETQLFERSGRSLILTDDGRIALDHAERIFSTGDDLLAALSQGGDVASPLRVGALSTLSRNFQLQFLRPLFADPAASVSLRSGGMTDLMEALEKRALDVVLTTEIPSVESVTFAARKVSEQPVGLHGRPDHLAGGSLAEVLAVAPLILPTETTIRTQFEDLTARLDVSPTIVASVDDMAMVRLLARDGVGLAVAPAVVLADEIASGAVVTAPFDLGVVEPFYAVTLPGKYPHPALKGLLELR